MRVFDPPRERVWKAFTESERLMHWWGPNGFSMQVAKLDLRPGGMSHYDLRSPDGRDMGASLYIAKSFRQSASSSSFSLRMKRAI
jgi:uncharacterized protein YndB with AHSA1/START domain